MWETFDKWWDAVGQFLTLKTQRRDAAYHGWHARDEEVKALREAIDFFKAADKDSRKRLESLRRELIQFGA